MSGHEVPQKVILDCDPGHDDALAILLAHGDPSIELVGITTVMGNQSLEKVTRNARAVAELLGLRVPIAAGADRPLLREAEVAADVHGDTGMDGPCLPEPTLPLDERHAVDLIIDVVMQADPGTITLVPTGALTNIALAARKEPRIIERVKQVVLMGGGIHEGNRTAVAEFNIYIDPEAADVVFSAGWPVVMVGLDVTHKALFTLDVAERIEALGTSPASFVGELMTFFRAAYRDAQGFDDPPVHDPCAVAHVIDPTVVVALRAPISVETMGRHTLGMTVVDLRTPAPQSCPTSAAVDIDVQGFWELVYRAVERIGEP